MTINDILKLPLLAEVIILLMIALTPNRYLLAEQPNIVINTGAGSGLFEQYCSSCHGVGGKGNGPAARALKSPPADLTQISKKNGGNFPSASIANYIDGREVVTAHGQREMPVWGRQFSAKVGGGEIGEETARGELAVLLEYLQSIQE